MVPHRWHGEGNDDPPEDLGARQSERSSGLDQFLGSGGAVVHEQHHQLEDDADGDDGDLLCITDAEPENAERDQRRDREVSRESKEWIEDSFYGGDLAADDPERKRD